LAEFVAQLKYKAPVGQFPIFFCGTEI